MPSKSLQSIAQGYVLVLACAALAGCGQATSNNQPNIEPMPTPTLSSLFEAHPTALPLIQPTTRPEIATSTVVPEPTVVKSLDAQLEEQFVRVPVYTDTLAPDWTLNNSFLTSFNTKSTNHVDRGKYSIEATPKKGFTTLVFAIKQTSNLLINRKRFAGVHFRLSGGTNQITNDAMAVSILGSNTYPYWNADDRSVVVDRPVTQDNPLFSETRLYFLGFDNTIPSNTWVDVVDWLAEQKFDPDYTYFTGFVIKVDQSLLQRYYLDQVELLLWPE